MDSSGNNSNGSNGYSTSVIKSLIKIKKKDFEIAKKVKQNRKQGYFLEDIIFQMSNFISNNK